MDEVVVHQIWITVYLQAKDGPPIVSDNSSNLCRNSKTGLSNSRGYLTKCVTIENTCKLLNGFLFFAQKNVLFFIARSLHLLGSKNTTPEILSNG
jgi:hypothetical protein